MDYRKVLIELAKVGLLFPEISNSVRAMAYDEGGMIKFLRRFGVPANVMEAAGVRFHISEKLTFSEKEIVEKVNQHLLMIGMSPTNISWNVPTNGYNLYLDSDWENYLNQIDIRYYQTMLYLEYPDNVTKVICHESDEWEPLKDLVKADIMPMGLGVDGIFYLSRK